MISGQDLPLRFQFSLYITQQQQPSDPDQESNEAYIHYGRPDLNKILPDFCHSQGLPDSDVEYNANEPQAGMKTSTLVFVCGPTTLTENANDLCRNLNIDFKSEVFEF